MLKEYAIWIKWNRPIDSVAGITNSSGAGPGITDGLQRDKKDKQTMNKISDYPK